MTIQDGLKIEEIETAAASLCHTRLTARELDNLPLAVRPADLADAYRIQDRLHALLVQAGHGPVVGHKIGCTTAVMQQYLKISSPCAGKLLAPTVQSVAGDYARDQLCTPGVECEIAVRLAANLTIDEGVCNDVQACRAQAARAVGAVMASIELVDARWQDFTQIPAMSLIADDFFAAGCVLGKEIDIDPQSMDTLSGQMWVNDQSVGQGLGSDILGHPLDALVWLALLRQRQGQPLRQSEFVSLGSLVQTQWIERLDEVKVEVECLGTATLRLS